MALGNIGVCSSVLKTRFEATEEAGYSLVKKGSLLDLVLVCFPLLQKTEGQGLGNVEMLEVYLVHRDGG